MDPRLEIRLTDTYPKCATCGHYGDIATEGSAECARHKVRVLNLAVCINWTERTELEAVADA